MESETRIRNSGTSGIGEKCNGTLTSVLAAYVNVQHNDWEDHLSSAVYFINTAQ